MSYCQRASNYDSKASSSWPLLILSRRIMQFNYLAAFPIPAHVLPPRLRGLLEPVGLSSSQVVEVASLHESDPHGQQAEHLHLLMAVVPGTDEGVIEVVSEAGGGVVEYSVPAGDNSGCSANFFSVNIGVRLYRCGMG
jgi:hypothetical protein